MSKIEAWECNGIIMVREGNPLAVLAEGQKVDDCWRKLAVASPAPAPIEREAVDVIATVGGSEVERFLSWHPEKSAFRFEVGTEVMTVAQHERIVAAKDAEIARLRDEMAGLWKRLDRFESHSHGIAALAEIERLRAQLAALQGGQAAMPVPRLKVRTVPKPYRCLDGSEGWTVKGDVVIYPTQEKAQEQADKIDDSRARTMFDALELSAQQAAVPVATVFKCEDKIRWSDRGVPISDGWLDLYLAAPAAPQQDVVMPGPVAYMSPNGGVAEAYLSHEHAIKKCRKWGGEPIPLVRADEVARLNPSPQTDAARDVLAERRRQVEAEGWTTEHDDDHGDGQMAQAAAAYALRTRWTGNIAESDSPSFWPWSEEWWKPTSKRRMLIKAGALILAEIERLDRLNPSAQGEKP